MKVRIPQRYNRIYAAILLIYIVDFTVSLDVMNVVDVPIFRYMLATLATWYLISGVWQTSRISIGDRKGLLFYLLMFVLLVWTVVIVLKGSSQLFSSFRGFLFFKQFISGVLYTYLIPILALAVPSLYLYRRVLKLAHVLCIVFLLLGIPFFGYFTSFAYKTDPTVIEGEEFGVMYGAGASLLAMTFSYFDRRTNAVTFLAILLAIAINGLVARRNQLVYFGSVLFFTVYLSTFTSSPIIRSRRAANFLAFVFGLFLLTMLTPLVSSKFSLVLERFATGFDSREGVVEEFQEDFNRTPIDWVVGRGLYGMFKSKTLAEFEGGTRATIENGYLYAILKGGGIYLGAFILLSLVAMYKGFFQSKNLLSKAFAAIIFIQLLDMVGFGLPSYYLKYIYVWLAIGACFSKRIRSLSDQHIKNALAWR